MSSRISLLSFIIPLLSTTTLSHADPIILHHSEIVHSEPAPPRDQQPALEPLQATLARVLTDNDDRKAGSE